MFRYLLLSLLLASTLQQDILTSSADGTFEVSSNSQGSPSLLSSPAPSMPRTP